MSCGCHMFLFIFPLSLSLSISVSVAEMLQASCPTVYLFNGSLQYVVKRLDWSWWMVTGFSGLVFSMRWTVGEMDSRLRPIWLGPFDGHTVHKTLNLHTTGITLKKNQFCNQGPMCPLKWKTEHLLWMIPLCGITLHIFQAFFLCGYSGSDSLCVNTIIGIVVGKSKLVIWDFLMRTKFATTILNTV